jgi:uncharacterized protein (TIGR03437 family)
VVLKLNWHSPRPYFGVKFVRVLIYSFLAFSCFGANYRPRVLAFEDHGQQYVSHGPGYSFSVASRAAVLNLGGHAVRMSLVGANPKSTLEALDHMPGKANYLLGREVRSSYHLYGRVRWRAVYSGVDVVFRGNQEHLEYDFEIGAHRDPGRIKLAFEGVDDIRIDHNGDLVLRAGPLQIHQPQPVAYQIFAGQKQPVEVAFERDASNHIGFRTGAYDHERPLVIDPQIVFDQTFGGSGQTMAAGLARDAEGDLYIAGSTNSTDFPIVNPAQTQLGTAPLLVTANAGQTWSFPSLKSANSVSAIVAAPSAPLTMYAATPVGVFASADGGTPWTAIAGTGLAGAPTALAVDAKSATTLYAATQQSIFVSRDGGTSWKASTNGLTSTEIATIATHPSTAGTVFASLYNPPALFRSTDFGQTWTQIALSSTQLPSALGAIVFGANGTIVAATNQNILISTDGGNIWTAGASQDVQNSQGLAISPNNPAMLYLVNVTSGLQRSTDGGQTFTPVLPSVTFSQYGRVAVDPRNPSTVYAADINLLYQSTNAGQTWSKLALPYPVTTAELSAYYPITPLSLFVSPANSHVFLGAATQNNVFVTKWSADGSQILYSTYLGGSGYDQATGIAVDGSGSAYLTGTTTSPDFPTTSGAFRTKLTSSQDVFVAKLSPQGSQLVYSTLLGSQSSRSASIAVDHTGDAIITGSALGTFPVTANAFQSQPVPGCTIASAYPILIPGSGDAFVTKLAPGGNALVYSTLLGGTCYTVGAYVTLDANGNVWVAGNTTSTDFPVTSDTLQPKLGGGYYDGFLASFNPSGALNYATFIGGPGFDTVNAIAFDQSGSMYLTGQTGGLSQPASASAFQPQVSASCVQFSMGPAVFAPQVNAFVLKLDPKAHSVQGLTYLGAPGCLSGSSIAVDSTGEPWIAGNLDYAQPSEPQTAIPFQIAIGAGFVSKFSADFKQLLFSTYFDSVAGIALDSSGLAYVAGTGAYNTAGTEPAYIAKIDPSAPAISLNAVLSAAPSITYYSSAAIAPGEVLRILGSQMGPATSTPGIIASGVLATNVAGVEVTFDGVAVPLLWVSAQEIDLVAPFELATKSTTTIQVQYNGAQSNPVQVGVVPTSLQILGVFNGDFTPNSASHPAEPGSIMILYFAGAGQTSPPSQDGQVNAAPFASFPTQVQINAPDNNPAYLPVTYAGAAPGLAAGIFQVNFVAPQQSSAYMSLILGNGNTSTQFSVSIKP